MAWRPADAGTTAGLRGHQHGDHSLISDHYTFYLYAARECVGILLPTSTGLLYFRSNCSAEEWDMKGSQEDFVFKQGSRGAIKDVI